ncbi:hypothetical protein HEP87_63400 [Streptomyces sp. S1D4-11]
MPANGCHRLPEGLAEGGPAYAVAFKGTTTAYPGEARPERPPCSGRGHPA